MLTSTLVSPNALKLLLPNSSSRTLEKQTVSISITEDIRFFINENETSKELIEQELKLIFNQVNDGGIILHADKSVDIEHVVKIMDIAYRNKYKIVLATTPK
tara:strand:+ start:297 stop:602 length:306 start_codon:yes stop_codon:yes gene_type:complete